MVDALWILILGMAIVFAVLAILSIAMTLLERLPMFRDKQER